jgi:bifunctional non-homologous end joining protein LigD
MSRVAKHSAAATLKSDPDPQRNAPRPRCQAGFPPQLCEPVDQAPSGPQWPDGFRMAARIDCSFGAAAQAKRADWSDKYPSAIAALKNINARTAYFDGELCGIDESGLPSFARTQAAATRTRRPCRLLRLRPHAPRQA